MSTMTDQEVNSLLGAIQRRLDAKRISTGIPLVVTKDGYRQEDEWLYVEVSPAQNGIRAYDYVKTLGEVEKELREEGIDHVLLVPVLTE